MRPFEMSTLLNNGLKMIMIGLSFKIRECMRMILRAVIFFTHAENSALVPYVVGLCFVEVHIHVNVRVCMGDVRHTFSDSLDKLLQCHVV